MRILIATDAWHPQINGVVRTLEALATGVRGLGAEVDFLTAEGFRTVQVPTYPGINCAIPSLSEIARRIQAARPDAVHIATEGPIGWATRRYCLRKRLPFSTSLTTRFPEYAAARLPIPVSWGYALLRRFHSRAALTMVSTRSLVEELSGRGFKRLRLLGRGVDTELFHPGRAIELPYARPIFISVGRIAPEKNLTAFLDAELPGSKLIIGDGPLLKTLRRAYPEAVFLGSLEGGELAAHLAAADVFVFPSKTDTFGLVQLEALASAIPVAAYPVTGPRDVIGDAAVGVLDEDLRAACLQAIGRKGPACREHAMKFSWAACAEQFLVHMHEVAGSCQDVVNAAGRHRGRTRTRVLKLP